MAQKIFVVGKPFSGKTRLVRDIYQELGNLLCIRGYYTEKIINAEEIERVVIHLFRDPSISHLLDLNSGPNDSQFEILGEFLVPELSLFPTCDLFLIDEIGCPACSTPRMRQQLLTVLASRIPVIATVSEKYFDQAVDLIHPSNVEIIRINSHCGEDLYLEILKILA